MAEQIKECLKRSRKDSESDTISSEVSPPVSELREIFKRSRTSGRNALPTGSVNTIQDLKSLVEVGEKEQPRTVESEENKDNSILFQKE